MILDIPIDAQATESRQVASLDGSPFVIDLSWSERSASWYVSVLQQREDVDPTPIVQGIRAAIGYPILAGVVVEGRPLGELIFIDVSEQGVDPTREDLGTRVRLYYFDGSEFGRG